MQLEPFPPSHIVNDGTLTCFTQEAMTKYPQFAQYFDVVVDFGVLGWHAVQLNTDEVIEYTQNVLALLKHGGMYVLKVDHGTFERIDFAQNIYPYFNSVNFSHFQTGKVIDEGHTQVFFFEKI